MVTDYHLFLIQVYEFDYTIPRYRFLHKREREHKVKSALNPYYMGLDFNIQAECNTDMEKIMEYGIMNLPAIVVNNKVVTFSKSLKTAEVEKFPKG